VNVTVYLVIGAAAVLNLGVIIWLHARQQAAMDRLDDRVAHLMAGVSLLTDTTEGGLRDFAMEIGRLSASKAPAQRSRPTTQRRVARAAKLGQSLTDIAATEGVSEGEVRLHLQMDKTRKERAHATLR
jgi:DNA-binding NarL/FixJ family response regulator